MSTDRLSVWIQVATGVAVIVGLALVVFELQQTRDLARAQIVHEGYSLLLDENRAIMGETFGDVYAKACLQPAELTDGEIVQIRQYHDSGLYMIRRIREIRESGVFDYSWEQVAKSYVQLWLSSEVGRLHYRHRVEHFGLEPDIRRLAEDVLANEQLAPCDDLAGFVKSVRAINNELPD